MMAAFQAWAASLGEAMIDPGSPLGPRKTVTSDGVSDTAADATLGGYTLIRAESLDDAVDAVKGHPFVGRGGTLQVSQAVSPLPGRTPRRSRNRSGSRLFLAVCVAK